MLLSTFTKITTYNRQTNKVQREDGSRVIDITFNDENMTSKQMSELQVVPHHIYFIKETMVS